mgnify:CR=1 FL=1
MDVFHTSDGVAVINHSDTIEDAKAFTTVGGVRVPARNCTHDGARIRKLTYAQVQQVRCGGEPLPTLDEVLSIIKDTGTTLNLEIKAWSADEPAALKRQAAQRAVSQVLAAGLLDQVVFSTFSWREMAGTVKALAPTAYLIGFLPVRNVRQPTSAMYQQARDARAAGVDALGFDIDYPSVQYLAFIRGLGMGIHTYDMTTDAKVRYGVSAGQAYVSSDDPLATRSILDDLAEHPTTPSYRRTLLRRSATVLDKGLAAGARAYPRIIGAAGLVPSAAQTRLQWVRLSVTVAAKTDGGHVELAPSNSRVDVDGVSVPIIRGASTRTVFVAPGDYGRLRVRATAATTRVRVKVVGYTNVS